MPIKKFEDYLYQVRIYFVFDESNENIEKIVNNLCLKHKTKKEFDIKDILSNSQAFKIKLDWHSYLIVLKEGRSASDDLSKLVHELFHTVFHAFDDRGLELNGGSEEAWAYYLGYWFQELFDFYLKTIRKYKNGKHSKTRQFKTRKNRSSTCKRSRKAS